MKRTIGLIAVILLSGCASTKQPVLPEDPYYAPIRPEAHVDNVTTTGSLFNNQTAQDLYSDSKAGQVGDIITVILQESTAASKSASTDLAKKNAMTVNPITAMGRTETLNGNSIELGIDTDSTFQGDSQANQANSLIGNISVNVIDVLANGNLVVRGEKWLTLNQGDEFIRLTGILRPQDIAKDNTVPSYKIANARIKYSGTGTFAKAQEQGWLTNFFYSVLWPF